MNEDLHECWASILPLNNIPVPFCSTSVIAFPIQTGNYLLTYMSLPLNSQTYHNVCD